VIKTTGNIPLRRFDTGPAVTREASIDLAAEREIEC
jgi:hypothetical protein